MFDRQLQRSRSGPRRIAAVAAASLALVITGSALAQPAVAPGVPHGGHMGPGGGDEMLGHLIIHARAQLNLNTSQAGMFDAAVAQTKAARATAQTLHQQVKDSLNTELAKPEPDLAAVAAVADGVQQQGIALHQQVRNAWLQLYGTFSPDQKAIVRDLLQKRIARMEAFRQKMMNHMSGS